MPKAGSKGKIRTDARAGRAKLTSSVAEQGWNRKPWIPATLLLAITAAAFLPSLSASFVNWDDVDNLLNNDNLRPFEYKWNWPAVKAIFSSVIQGNYNPLPILSFAVEKRLFAPDPKAAPAVFHITNLGMHLACTLLVYVLFLQLRLGPAAAFAGALLFGIHPMRVESVAWITERKDVLYGMFFLASLLTYLKFIRSEQSCTRWYAWTLLLSVSAYLSKVQAVALPLCMVALDFLFQRKWRSPRILIIEKAPWWAMSLLTGLINIYFLRVKGSLDFAENVTSHGPLDRLAVGAYAYFIYLVKWIFPYRMSPLYPYPARLPMGAYLALVLVPLFLAIFAYRALRAGQRNLLFGAAFFTFNVMFVLQIVGAGQGFLADRFTYIAYIGLFFIAAFGYQQATASWPRMKACLHVCGILYLAVLAVMTWNQCKIWTNGGTLWAHVLKYRPDVARPWTNAATYYREEEKNYLKAAEFYSRAIELDPKNAADYNSLGKTYFDLASSLDPRSPGSDQEKLKYSRLAIQNYTASIEREAAAQRPDARVMSEVYVNRGAVYGSLGMADQAMADLNRGIQLDAKNESGYLNRALLYIKGEQLEKAIQDHNEYLKINPFDPDILFERGLCRSMLGQAAEAIRDFDKAIALRQNQPRYFVERAKARLASGDRDGARSDALRARQMGVQVPPELMR